MKHNNFRKTIEYLVMANGAALNASAQLAGYLSFLDLALAVSNEDEAISSRASLILKIIKQQNSGIRKLIDMYNSYEQ